MSAVGRRGLTLAAVVVVCLLVAVPAWAIDSVESPDTVGDVGPHTSLALDAAGNPVVSYYDSTDDDLKVLHCNDPNCAGGGDSVESPDTTGGAYTSLALDDTGYPVVSYYDGINSDLKVLHCNDPNCAGGGDSVESPDTAGFVGEHTSLELDAGNPVVSYHDAGNNAVKLLHCDDPNCAGGGESVESPDTGIVVESTSLALDDDGHPVVSYGDSEGLNLALKLLHCNDPDCAGGDESVERPDTGYVLNTSLALDDEGNPVVSYHAGGIHGDLKLLHCNDPGCAGGGDSVASPDATGNVGEYPWLALDAAGNPVVSYHHTSHELKLLHCNDPNCAGVESRERPDAAGTVGLYTSLALDAAGNPVVSYYDFSNGDLKLLHCDDPDCAPNIAPVAGLSVSPRQGRPPLRVTLDATGSSDPEGDDLKMSWDLDNDGRFDDGSGEVRQRTFTQLGRHRVRVRVSDPDGAADLAAVTVVVEDGADGDGGPVPSFRDVPESHTFHDDIIWLAVEEITLGCNPEGTLFCPESPVTRGQMAAFLVRFLGLTDSGAGDFFTDDDDSIFEEDIDKLAHAGITLGCDDGLYCPKDSVTRGQMAAFLVRALDLPAAESAGFDDTAGSVFADSIDRLAAAGITQGCTLDLFCPLDYVTRGQMAAFLHRGDPYR